MEVREVAGEAERAAAMKLRYDVFVIEQGVALEEDVDGLDGEAQHLVAVQDGTVVATCRLLHDADRVARLGRMAVAPPARRRGIATELLREAERVAARAGSTRMVLHAQTDAIALYDRAGYRPEGARFHEAGIEHQTMVKGLGRPA